MSIRVVILPTTSIHKTDVPVNTNHKIANGINPINTDPKPETNSFTIENTFFMSIKFLIKTQLLKLKANSEA